MESFSTYTLLIGATSIILFSFLFRSVARRTNVPAVLILLALGIGLQYLLRYWNINIDFTPFLQILGLIGLYMVVLEAALHLRIRRSKIKLILKSFAVAVIGLASSIAMITAILYHMLPGITWIQALFYGTPLSVMTSAIVIPGTKKLRDSKRDFHHYESSLAEILGIMVFFFLVWMYDPMMEHGFTGEEPARLFLINAAEAIGIALITSYGVLLLFQRIQQKAELFVLLSVLLLLYGVSKELELSPLVVIVVFGIVVSNLRLLFRGRLRRLLKPETFEEMEEGLHELTNDTSFIVRIFFFVIFGASIVLSSLLSLQIFLISGLILALIYLLRLVLIRIFIGKNMYPQVWISPRGLSTLLLFYAIPITFQTDLFNPGILLFIIIGSGLIMTAGKISHRMRREEEQEELQRTQEPKLSAAAPPPARMDKSRTWMERQVAKYRYYKRGLKWKITHHPLYIVQRRRFKRFLAVTMQTLGVQMIFTPESKLFNRRLRNVIAILRNPARRVNLKQSQDYQKIKKYINRIIFHTDTLEGLLFDIGLFILIILSVVIVMLGSMSDIELVWQRALRALDWIITILFTIEYALRIWTSKQPRKYIFSFFGLVDLLSILPLYAEVLFSGLYSLEIIRIIRLVRIFRVLKLIRFVSEAELIIRSLKASANKIFVFLFFVMIVCTILGSLMFIIEGPENGFINIPKGIYWAVVTLTTVGYGDIHPITGLGQFIAMILMVMGYGVIAVPTGLVAAGVMSEARTMYKQRREQQKFLVCPKCGKADQHSDAEFCYHCGTSLRKDDHKADESRANPPPET